MARKQKGRNPHKNAKRVKAKSGKSGRRESHSSSSSNTNTDGQRNRSRGSAASIAAPVELIGADELDTSADPQRVHRSSVAADVKLTSAATARDASTRDAGNSNTGNGNTGNSNTGNGKTRNGNAGGGATGWTRSALVEGTRAGKMPRPWFKKWGWWFLPLSVLGGAVGAWWGVRHIEGQVQAVAPEILKTAGIDPSGLTFDADYRNIAVAGELPQGVTVEQVERLLEESTGAANEDIRHATVTARMAPAPEVKPEPPKPELPKPEPPKPEPPKPEPAPVVVEPTGEISVAAFADGETIRLSGSVPDQEHANRLLASAAVAVGEDNVINELSVLGLAPSATEPELQIERLAQVLPQLGSGISSAELSLGDETFSGSIDALDVGAKSLLDPIVATTGGNAVTVTAPEPKPLQVDVFANYQGQQIILYGEVVTEAQRQTLMAAAAESVGESNVVSTLKVLRPGNEPAESDAEIALMGDTLRQYDGLESAESRLNASDLYLRGVATNSAAKQSVEQSLQSASNEGLSVSSDIFLLNIDSELTLLQDEFDFLAGEIRENVVFATNSDVLDSRATGVLDKVVNAIQKFERARVVVSGHTDSLGAAGGNQVLSARRATAVLNYLAASGVDVDRLRAVGLGESQPVGDNSTAAGRQQNRRVEFTAVETF